MKVLKICLMVAGLAILLAAAWPDARLTLVWAAGRCQGLLLPRRGPEGFELVKTPMGQYWTVPNDRFLKFTLGEEKLEIYDGDEVAVKMSCSIAAPMSAYSRGRRSIGERAW